MPNESFAPAVRFRERVVAEEPDDGRHVTQIRVRRIRLPVEDAGLVHADPFSDVSLEHLQAEAPSPDVVAAGLWLAEQNFRRVKGYQHLPQLLDELAKLSTPPPAQAQAA